MGFADTRGAKQDDVLAVGEKAQRRQLLDLLAVDGGLKAEVEISQRLLKWEVRQRVLASRRRSARLAASASSRRSRKSR